MIQLSKPLAVARRSTLFKVGSSAPGWAVLGLMPMHTSGLVPHPPQNVTVVLVGMGLVVPDAAGVFVGLENGQRNGLHDSKLLLILNIIIIVPESTGKINSFISKILPYLLFLWYMGLVPVRQGDCSHRAYKKGVVMLEDYKSALRAGQRAYRARIARVVSRPIWPCWTMCSRAWISWRRSRWVWWRSRQTDLVGTKTSGRHTAFSYDFMPLL